MKAIKTTFIPAGNVRGSRIKASDCDHNSITLSWDHGLDADQNHAKAAQALRDKMGWTGAMIGGGLKDCFVWTFAKSRLQVVA